MDNKQKFMIAAVVVAILYGARKMTEPRGIRNNNPGNIENNGVQWQGLSPNQTDSRFYQFKAPVWGIRAMARLLQNYQKLYGLNTVAGIIDRWAPSVENDTSSYVQAVAKDMGVLDVTPLDLSNTETLAALVKAVIYHENGKQPYSDNLINEAIDLV